ncbi:MAG: RNB domain-containing ribonuclease [Opitutales bacterium]|jgi:ribonuclease R|nr:RNB domain-containing ribonuclease [Opitutales bacterium]MBT5167264.1 RNB domain-containing ribonuclease [Opitutales bacterium]MBT5816010.1 RNB domain-containing ribonuclease [Opitutales bacterium]MBT6381400.1 RNB domain-containing ribonuclease [Opitutales bacterium]
MKLREQIIGLMQNGDYIPLSKNALSKSLGLFKKDRRKLDFELRNLLSKGELVIIKGDRYCIPKDADLLTGSIRFRQKGSGFVIPDNNPGTVRVEPIEIDAADTGVSMHGDQVVIRLYDEINRPKRDVRAKGKPKPLLYPDRKRGRVIRIQKRARDTIVGNLQKTRFFYYVVPDDPRIIHDIYVPDPADSKTKPLPTVGSKVVVKLHEWEQKHVNPEGEIILNLGATHEPQAELMSILHKYELNPEFPSKVIKAAKAIPAEVQKKQLEGREDLRDVFTFTIDPDDAKDFDDALSMETLKGGLTRIGIHIADVGAYVQPNGALDQEAHKRGNSSYLVGTVIPMLPRTLSNGICSLKEDVDRITKAVFLTFTKEGKIKDIDFANTVIRSNKRLTYKQAYTLLFNDDLEVSRSLKLPPSHQTGSTGRPMAELNDKELSKLQSSIRTLWSFASKMRADRMQSGSLNLDMQETKIFVDEKGYADRLEKVINDESHQLIEEYMLAANEAVAKAIREAKLPCIYRVHEEPDEERLNDLREFLATFGITVANLNVRSEVNKLIKILEEHPQGHILKSQLLRSLKKACYRSTPDGHYGLHKRDYCHFTSPIRRYADLAVHRVFDFFLVKFKGRKELHGGTPRYNISRAKTLAEHLSHTEVNSTEAERESVKVKLLEFFERELEKPKKTRFQAVITEVRNHGMFIELVESNAFGMVHISTLKDDLYNVNNSGTALEGRRTRKKYAVGQKINVFVHRVDRFKRQVDFRLSK